VEAASEQRLQRGATSGGAISEEKDSWSKPQEACNGRKVFEEVLRWFPKRTAVDEEARQHDAVMRRLSAQAHYMLKLPTSFSGAHLMFIDCYRAER
jgi:hypothetical protein